MGFLGAPRWLAPLARAGGRRAGAARDRRRAGARESSAPSGSSSATAVAIAVVGIVFAVVRLKPARLVPKEQAVPERGLRARAGEQVVRGRDLRPRDRAARRRRLAAAAVDGHRQWLIDGLLVNGSARLMRLFRAASARYLQTGQVSTYAWVHCHRRAGRARRLHAALGDARLSRSVSATSAGSCRRCCIIPLVGAHPHLTSRGSAARRGGRHRRRPAAPASIALVTLLVEFLVSLGLWWSFDAAQDDVAERRR